MLKAGDKAPAFSLTGDDEKAHALKEFKGNTLILYFYPRNATPGCTVEACELREHRVRLAKHGAIVVGVSPDSVASHQKWQAKERFGFLLLSDPAHEVAAAYGAWGEKTLYGRNYEGLIRSTFIIDGAGRIRSAQYKVSPKGHAAALLAQLAGEAPAAATPTKKPASKKPAAATPTKKPASKKPAAATPTKKPASQRAAAKKASPRSPRTGA